MTLTTPFPPPSPVDETTTPGGDNAVASPRRRWRRLAVRVGGVLAVTIGAVVALDLVLDHDGRDVVAIPETITRLEIDVDGGTVDIVATDDDTTTIELTTHGGLARPHRSETVRDATLVVQATCNGPISVSCGADYVIHLPRSVDIVARGGGTDYTMTELGDDVDVDVALSGGDADLGFRTPPRSVRGRVDGGDLTITVPEGTPFRVRADSSGGSTEVDIATDPASDRSIDVSSSGGDVALRYSDESTP